MIEFLADYGAFMAKTVSVLALLGAGLFGVLYIIGSAKGARKGDEPGEIKVRSLNKDLEVMKLALEKAVLPEAAVKARGKERKKRDKERKKATEVAAAKGDERGPRVFVLDFRGDLKASAVQNLRQEITAVLALAESRDEVVVRLSSPGGMVHAYGLAASQLKRVTDRGVPLTVCVDAVAASGGYMMACIANKIVAAPFAVIGSIGVVAQIPNFHRLLKKQDIDVEVITAGEYKRTLTFFGENTEKARQKFREEVDDTQLLFKEFVSANRPQVEIDRVATGEHWYGTRALELALVDELGTSDEYLVARCDEADVYEVRYKRKKPLAQRFGMAAEETADRLLGRWWQRLQRPQA